MTRSGIFHTEQFKLLEARITDLLNGHQDFLSVETASSPRAVGDAVQSILSAQFGSILGDLAASYSDTFARRAMADLAFTDHDGLYYVIDVKTHRIDAHFSMPNLISVERLTRFYEDDRNYFVVLLVKYRVDGIRLHVERVHLVPIESLSWQCLTIGALGWGQIQIANATNVIISDEYLRKNWMIELCDIMMEFYPREISKIENRMNYFARVRQQWLAVEG